MREFETIKDKLWASVRNAIWIESIRSLPILIRWTVDEHTIYNDQLEMLGRNIIDQIRGEEILKYKWQLRGPVTSNILDKMYY